MAGLHVRSTGDVIRLAGYAAVYGQRSENLGGFREVLQRGAFADVIEARPDVRLLVNHDSFTGAGLPLARTLSGTLALVDDPLGLRFVGDLAPIPASDALATLVQRGDITQMSFAFKVDPAFGGVAVWEELPSGDLLRTVVSVSHLYDVSLVVYPAYPQTSVEVV